MAMLIGKCGRMRHPIMCALSWRRSQEGGWCSSKLVAICASSKVDFYVGLQDGEELLCMHYMLLVYLLQMF